MTHRSPFPEQRLMRPGAVLGTIAHAVFVAHAPSMEASQSWDGENYCVNDHAGGRGAIAFRGNQFVGVFFDSHSSRSPYHSYVRPDPSEFLKGLPKALEPLAWDRALKYVFDDFGNESGPLISAAFWGDGKSRRIAAAEPWGDVFEHGAHLVKYDLLPTKKAVAAWTEDMELTPQDVEVVRELFQRRIAEPAGRIQLTPTQCDYLAERAKDNEGFEACQRSFAAVGISWPSRKRGAATKKPRASEPEAAAQSDSLFQHAAHGNLAGVRRCLAAKAKINARTDGLTPLMVAVRNGHLNVAKWLIAAGAKLEFKADDETPLLVAAAAGDVAMLKALVAGGAKVNARNRSGQTPLIRAVQVSCVKLVKFLLSANASPLLADRGRRTCLHYAAQEKTDKIIARLLIRAGAQVNARQSGGNTPLHMAAYQNRVDVAKILVSAGADVNVRGSLGFGTVSAATTHGHADMVRFLLEAGYRPRRDDDALGLAAQLGHLRIVKMLLEHDFPVNSTGYKDRTPLRHARTWKHKNIAAALKAAGGMDKVES